MGGWKWLLLAALLVGAPVVLFVGLPAIQQPSNRSGKGNVMSVDLRPSVGVEPVAPTMSPMEPVPDVPQPSKPESQTPPLSTRVSSPPPLEQAPTPVSGAVPGNELDAAIAFIDELQRSSDPMDKRVTTRRLLPVSPIPADARLVTMEKILTKYGLTNVMMSLAGLMAYGAMDNRGVVMPKDSPADLEGLLDLNATEERLRLANVVFVSQAEVANRKPVKARRLGLSFGSRERIGSLSLREVKYALTLQRYAMNASKDVSFVAQRDFFLAFPFRATRPLDVCFYLQRMVFSRKVREAAKGLLMALRDRGVKRLMAAHLRIEFDAAVTLQSGIHNLPASELRRFIEQEVVPIAKQAGVDAIYVCAGRLKEDYLEVLRTAGIKIFVKSDFPELNIPLSGGKEDKTVVTSHFAAAVDMLILQSAAVAMSSNVSTFALNVIARRCQTPHPQSKLKWADLEERFGNSTLRTIELGSADATTSGWDVTMPAVQRVGGAYIYDFEHKGRKSFGFTKPRLVGCHKPHKRQCFYAGDTDEVA